MSMKRTLIDLDPDYEDITEQQWKKQKILQDDAKETTVKKIEKIIQKHFNVEIQYKESEVKLIDQRLHEARHVLDRLRACIVANYYAGAGQLPGQTKLSRNQPPVIHPAVKKYLGKTVKTPSPASGTEAATADSEVSTGSQPSTNGVEEVKPAQVKQPSSSINLSSTNATSVSESQQKCHPRYKVKKRIVVGNVSKYIPPDKRDDNDRATHKWMVYVRGPRNEPHIDHFVKKVWFFLHPSYRPNDLVEICQAPFHLTRRGWGEFPVRVQLHFIDSRNKRVDIIHHLKLDKTYTGLQTLGSETHVDIELDRATLPEENLSKMPSLKNQNDVGHQSQRSGENIETEQNVSGPELMEVKQETESENSLGVVWSPLSSHDHMRSHDLNVDANLDMLAEPDMASEQSIMGNILHAEEPDGGLIDNGKSVLVKDDVLLSSEACKDLEVIKNAPVSGPKSTSHSCGNSAETSSCSSGRLQISHDIVSEGWTRLQIKQEDGQEQSPVTNGSLLSKMTEVKDEPVDDTYPSVSSSGSVKQPSARVKNIGFQPIAADTTQPGPGWMHVQIKSEPTASERSASVCSGSRDLMSPTVESEFQPSVPSSPCTPERMIRLEAGHPCKSAGAVDKASLVDAPTEQSSLHSSLEGGNEFSAWKHVKGKSGGALRKQTLTLGVGVGQLSSGIQSESGVLLGHATSSKSSAGQEHVVSTSSSPSHVATSTTSASLKAAETLSTTTQNSAVKQSPGLDAVYIQCVDAAGKVYLIPQQMLKTSAATEQKQALKPLINSPGRKDALKTTVVGSGPNKATLTYLLSSQAPRATRPLSNPTSKTTVPAVPIAMPTAAPLAQKLLVIPGVGVNPRQLALVQQPRQNDAALITPSLPLGSTSCQTRPLLVRDQAGNMQIVQMMPPSSLIQTSSLQGSGPLVSGKSLLSKTTVPKSGIRVSAGEKTLLSPVAPSSKPAVAVLPDSSVYGNTQSSPLKSLVISQDTLGQLQSGQLLQIELPQGKTSAVGADAARVVGLTQNHGKATSVIDSPLGKADIRPTTILQQGTVMSKPPGSVSLLRPGLISSKLGSTGQGAVSKANTSGLVPGKPSCPGLIKGMPADISSSLQTIPSSATKKVDVTEAPKCSLIGQSLLKSASTGNLVSLPQKQSEVMQKDKNQRDAKNKPLYISTKIGSQTVLLKFDNEQDAKKTLTNDLKSAADVESFSLVHSLPSASVEKSVMKSSGSALSGQKASAIVGKGTSLTSTIKHGSILGMHKQKEPCKSDYFEINLMKFHNFESLLTFVVQRHPLVEENVDRSVLPYCARSEEEFLNWNVGKRRAAEWQRASRVRKRILSSLLGESSFHGEKVWSTKEIVTWCRQHLYSPLDKVLTAHYNGSQHHKRRRKPAISHPPGGFSSYTDHKRVLASVADLTRSPDGRSEEEEIDIVSVDLPTKKVIKSEPLETNDERDDAAQAEVIPLSGVTRYIHQVAAQVGVNFEPVLQQLDSDNKVYMSMSEEVLLSALKCFVDGLIRKSVALRHHTDRFSDEVSARDVYSALVTLPRMDFLLNHGLGVHLMTRRSTDDTSSDV